MPLRSVKMNRFIFGFQRRGRGPEGGAPVGGALVPAAGLVPEVDAAVEQLLHADDCHRAALLYARGPARDRAPRLSRPPGGDRPGVPRRHSPGDCPRGASLGPRWRLPRRAAGRRTREVDPSQTDRTTTIPAVAGCPPGAIGRSTDRAGGAGAAGCSATVDGVRARLLLVALCLALVPVPAAAEPTDPAAPWTWPLAGRPAVTRPVSLPAGPFGPGHPGVDLAAAPGATVLAAGDGVVAFAGVVAGRPVVSIDHPGGLRTTYEPVDPSVAAGQAVARGSPVGTLLAGHPGCPAAACLHWGVRRGGTYLDPLTLLRAVRVRLLPWR